MFTLKAEDNKARTGILKTAHHKISTPFFMPVATKGSVKYCDMGKLEKTKTECVIANSLILSFKPGLDMFRKTSGIHNFMNWKRGVFTDSGGFQTLKESLLVRTTDSYAYFKNPWDGKVYPIGPEEAMDIQSTIGSDVAMCLDDVPVYSNDYEYVKEKMIRTHKWALRCKKSHDNDKQLLFGIAQGGLYKDLREKSIAYIKDLDFDGFALGGLAIGEPISKMYDLLRNIQGSVPKDKVCYLMGVGNPLDIIEAVSLGVDCFDSTFPTMNARHNNLFTWDGVISIKKTRYKDDLTPIDERCTCETCKRYTKAYLHHLMRTREPTYKILATQHNLSFMQELMKEMRTAIQENRFEKFKKGFVKDYNKKKD